MLPTVTLLFAAMETLPPEAPVVVMLPALIKPFVDVREMEPPCPVPSPLLEMVPWINIEYAEMFRRAPDEFGIVASPDIELEAMFALPPAVRVRTPPGDMLAPCKEVKFPLVSISSLLAVREQAFGTMTLESPVSTKV